MGRNGKQAPTIAHRIRRFRESASLGKTELADAVGVTPAAVTQWESGDATPTVSNLERIATACGVDLECFFGPLPAEQEPAA